jgi:hypothetical protein
MSGCVLVPPQLPPPSHVVTIEPNGSVVKDEYVVPIHIMVPFARRECLENGVQVSQECDLTGCTYTRDGKVSPSMYRRRAWLLLEYDGKGLYGEWCPCEPHMQTWMVDSNLYGSRLEVSGEEPPLSKFVKSGKARPVSTFYTPPHTHCDIEECTDLPCLPSGVSGELSSYC